MLVVGGLVGGLMLGFFVSPLTLLVSRIPALRLAFLLTAVLLAVGGLFFKGIRIFLPERSIQVFGSQLLRFSRERAAFGWGVELGLGYRTFMVTPVYYVMVAAIAAQVAVAYAVVLGAFYGSVRTATIALFSHVKSRDGELERPRGVGLQARMRALQVLLCIGLLLVGF